MNIVEQSFEILSPTITGSSDYLVDAFVREAKLIECAGRTAYKSEDKITQDSYDEFIRGLISRGHEAVIEFGSMMVKFITDRGVSHELVRHRMCSFVQESTRYCNYSKKKFDGEITCVKPSTCDAWTSNQWTDWINTIYAAEKTYLDMLRNGLSPQQARSVLPNSLKTEIVVRANFREWRHIFKLRAVSKAAHPDMRALMLPFYTECRKLLPCVFDMGEPEHQRLLM
jgi:thymidylate synthase (FAD)